MNKKSIKVNLSLEIYHKVKQISLSTKRQDFLANLQNLLHCLIITSIITRAVRHRVLKWARFVFRIIIIIIIFIFTRAEGSES